MSQLAEELLGEDESAVGLDMTPFVDIIFNLLLFFLLSTSYVQHTALDLSLPRAGRSAGVTGQFIQVDLKVDDSLFLNSKPVATLEELAAGVAAEKEKGQTIFLLRADEGALHGKVVEILDLAKSQGLDDIRVATRPKVPADRGRRR